MATATREHRLAAVHAYYGPPEAGGDAYAHVPSYAWAWVKTGQGHGLHGIAMAIAEAEERGAQRERVAVATWLRTTPKAAGMPVSIDSSRCIARLADDIDRGEHLIASNEPSCR